MTSVLIFGYAELIREGLASLLQGCAGVTVLGAYGNYREMLDSIDEQIPDVLVIDLYELEDVGSLIAEALLVRYPSLKLFVLSESADLTTALALYQAGVYAYLHKSHSHLLFQDAIENIARQRIFLYAEAPRDTILTSFIHAALIGKTHSCGIRETA